MKRIVLMMLMTIIILVPGIANASWYSEPYNWAYSSGIIGKKSDKQLMENVSSQDFYTILFKYFEMKGVQPSYEYFKMDDYKTDNYILVATERQLSTLASKDWLTNDEYKKAVTLIENANNILEKNSKYFEASEIESIKYYLDVMDYILYTKIYDYEYKQQVIYDYEHSKQIYVTKPKNADLFIKYKLIPYYGDISREEFLNLMYHYTVAEGMTFSTGVSVGYYKYNNVLLGYQNNLMLTLKLNYAHMVTFLSRM